MANTRFKGANSSERLTLSTLSDSDMFQTRHLPGTVNDADKGVSKSLLQALPVAVCATAAATAAKVMTLAPESCPDFTLVNGRVIHVYFSAANTASTPTANVAGTGAIPIVYPSGDFVGNWAAGVTMDLMYISITVDNTAIERWVVVSSLPVDTVAVDNMNSVTSNAVASAIDTAAVNISEYTNITGLNVYKVGKVVFIRLYRAQTSGNEVTLGTLPEGYRPVTVVRGILIKQENITPTGEITILYNGDVKISNIGGSNFNGTYVAEVCFITRD